MVLSRSAAPRDSAVPGNVDDRANPVGLLDPASLDPHDERQSALKRVLAPELSDATKDPRSLAAASAGCLVKLAMSAVILSVLAFFIQRIGIPITVGWRMTVLLVVFAIVVPLLRKPGDWAVDRLVTRRIALARRVRVIARAREAGVCAGCGYSLAGLRPEHDGCTVCAECGAAWRLNRD